MRTAGGLVLVPALALLLALAGCSAAPTASPEATGTAAPAPDATAAVTAAPDGGVAPAPDPRAPGAERVRADGAAVPGGDGVVAWVLPTDPAAEVAVEPQGDGSVRVTVRTAQAAVTGASLAPAEGVTATVLEDGSAVLRRGDVVVGAVGTPDAAQAPARWFEVEGVLVLRGRPAAVVEVLVGTSALASATWGEAEGGRSLAVVPAAWVRGGSLAAQEVLAAQLAVAQPEAATATMQAQLWCHALGAPDKDAWNLEPWRPEVGTVTLLATRCNPTDDDV
ncbi:DUF2599 domain-containing protein [Cellulomonas sp. JZ18]|uniref:DUF2599 domain-containing protein n=1 Tax=Cellulomonas sp. JZ18 TaxID=2654191 RepID=UPI0012D3AE14|nr:DUF2599 domain-containing protein [Cellulomonas sp. JZ18]QGQ18439.1 DUF2599 domain-containing protein [Cellulomonas sp. JZ18]